MKRVKNILENEKNQGVRFAIHIKNKKELDDLADVLTECGCTIQFSVCEIDDLREWMKEEGEESNYDTCFRINEKREVAKNPSIEHWRLYGNDILEIRNGELVFHEKDYTEEDAKIEAEKIWRDKREDEEYIIKKFGFDKNITKDGIIKWLLGKSN